VWPAAVVVTNPFPKNDPNVPFAHRNHEVQALAADRTDHAFAEGIRLWSAHRCLENRQAHGLKRAVNAFRVDRVAIVDHESIRLVAPEDHPKLLRRPLRGRMRGHVPVQNAPRAHLEHDENVQQAECRRHHDEQSLARTDRAWFRTNVLQACVPGFGQRRGRDGMYLHLTWGHYEAFEYPTDAANPAGEISKPVRTVAEARLKIPETPLQIGFDANLGKGHDDVRFSFGVRFDIGDLLAKVKQFQ